MYQFRALIGPRYNHYDWTGIGYGSTANFDIYSQLSADIDDDSVTTVSVMSGAAFPSAGGFFVGGNYGFEYEYCQYTGKSTNNLTGCVRENVANSNHDGYHESDEVVWFWYPIQDDDGVLRFSLNYDPTLSAQTWEASLRGYMARHWAIRNNHLIAVQVRTAPDADWTLELLGVIDSPTFHDDHNRYGQWTMKIRHVGSIWDDQRVKGVRVGQFDIAKHATAAGSTSLVLASDERAASDYTQAEPDFDADKTVDDDTGTLWIAERFMGTQETYLYTNADPENDGSAKFSQLYLNPPDDAPDGARWIEIISMTSDGVSGLALISADDTVSVSLDISGASISTNERLIICEDATVFAALNPLSAATATIEDSSFFDHIETTGGDMWLRFGATNSWRSRVAWGDGNHDPQGDNFPHVDAPSGQYGSGTLLTAPAKGETLRYIHDTTGTTEATDFWDIGKVHNAGYRIDTTPDQWVAVTFPGLGLFLRDDITASDPGNGDKLYIVDAAGNGSTAGIADSGLIYIGGEYISYQSKDEEGVTLASSGARGYSGGTAAAIHDEGDPVYTVESGVITNAPMLESVSWNRYGGTSYPANFTVSRSNILEPRTPSDSGWQADYTEIEDVNSASSSSWSETFGSPTRVQTLLIEIEKMTEDPGRPRLNEISAILEKDYYLSDNWLDNPVAAHTLIEQILVDAGWPGGAIDNSGSTPSLSDVETGEDAAWTVAVDMAEFAGVKLTVDRVSHLSIAADTFWTGTPSYSFTWDETTAADVQQSNRNDVKVSQVALSWRSADGADSGIEYYPSTPGIVGQVLEIDEQVYASSSSAQAAARKKFYLAHWPYTLVVEAKQGYPTMAPGYVHRLVWSFNRSDGELERLYLVTGVDHWIEDYEWHTTVYLQRIERLVGW